MSAAVAGDPRAFAAPQAAAYRAGAEATLLDGTLIADHWFEVPLDHAAPAGRTITVFAREYVAQFRRESREALPWLLFLQGGPGGKGMRPARLGGWMKQAAQDFRILMLDQRGTGLSSPVTRHSLPAEGTGAPQAEYLVHFRAPSIVQDAESIRLALGSGPWTVFGQSFGGFCTLSYLSWHPDGVVRALITGGLAPLDGHAERVYRATYPRMRHRNEEYFARFPRDRDRLAEVYARVRTGVEALPDGSPVTVGRVQMLGMLLGGNTRMDQLHYLLEEAFAEPAATAAHPDDATSPDAAPAGDAELAGGDRPLSDTFLHGLYQQVSRATNPLYLVMHESIYAQPAALGAVRSDTGTTDTGWAAQRVLAGGAAAHGSGELADFDPERAEVPLLTGEMVFDWYTELDPALRPLAPAAEALARRTGWGPLYDLDVLAANTVPAAAAVYTHDVYVDRDLSLRTAGRVRGLRVWETDAFHHDGLADDGPAILRKLLELTAS